MTREIHYFSAELKTKIDVIPRGCFKYLCYGSTAIINMLLFRCGIDVSIPAMKV